MGPQRRCSIEGGTPINHELIRQLSTKDEGMLDEKLLKVEPESVNVANNDGPPVVDMTNTLTFGTLCWSLLKMWLPIFIGMCAWIGMTLTDTALVGHTGSRFLDAMALQSLWTSSTGVFISAGAFGVLGAQAFGMGNKSTLGVWMQVSFVVNTGALLLVMGFWAATGPFLKATGVCDSVKAKAGVDVCPQGDLVWPAWYYALVLGSSLPGKMWAAQINQYLQVQSIMKPGMWSSIVAVVLNFCFGMVFVLGIPFSVGFDANGFDPHEKNGTSKGNTSALMSMSGSSLSAGMPLMSGVSAGVANGGKGFGFWACPIVTASMEYVQLTLLLGYFLYRVDEYWPGVSIQNIFSRGANDELRIWTFLKLWAPMVLSTASDFWRVSVIGVVAAGLGSDQLGVFNASYRILWFCLVLSGSFAFATGILLGQALGAGKAGNAKYTALVGLGIVLCILTALGVFVAILPRQLGSVFSSDPEIQDYFVKVRYPLAATMVMMNFAVALERVPSSMGKAKEVLFMGVIGSWGGQVPGVLLVTKFWMNDLVGLYTGMALGYALLCLLLGAFILHADWRTVTEEVISAHSEKKKGTTNADA